MTTCGKCGPGFVGIDVDSLHHYYPGWQGGQGAVERPARNVVYERAIPRFLALLAELGVRGTFFIVGQDVETPLVRRRIQEIVASGHEIASHSFSHPQNFLRLSHREKEAEIAHAEEVLRQVAGVSPVGFRAPAWGVDERALDVLEARGYVYDSSILPSSLLPLLKVIYSWQSRGRLGPGDLLGHCRYSRAPLRPYYPARERIERPGGRKLLELPLAVVPLGRLPFWATIHLTVGRRGFFLFCYRLLRRRLPAVSYQCHAVDLLDLGADGVPLAFRRLFGLRRSLATRRRLLKYCLAHLAGDYDLMPARELVDQVRAVVPGAESHSAVRPDPIIPGDDRLS